MNDSHQQQRLRQLPGVDRILNAAQQNPALRQAPKSVLVRAIREILEELRQNILTSAQESTADNLGLENLLGLVVQRTTALQAFNLQHVINATGVVVHTNLGRSCLASAALDHMATLAASYSNLEFDLNQGRRGSRYSAVEALLCELSGAQAAMAVNNNAGAVLLCLDTLGRDKSVVLSRGELVEIGGSFRIPDVMAKSGARLKEVGTTNRTHLRDYENAIGSDTGLLLKVHTSNYRIMGFTAAVDLKDLVTLGARFNLPVMEDLGSGSFIDFSAYGLSAEPTVQASVAAGADIVTFSGDKLLGGPQAGLIVGKKERVERIKRNPLTRALRIDKLTLAALEATLRLYRDEKQAVAQIPTLRMLLTSLPELEGRARRLADALKEIGDRRLQAALSERPSMAGGGALPQLEIPSCCVTVRLNHVSANSIEKNLRAHRPPIIGRIENDLFIIDTRTILEEELAVIVAAFAQLLKSTEPGDS